MHSLTHIHATPYLYLCKSVVNLLVPFALSGCVNLCHCHPFLHGTRGRATYGILHASGGCSITSETSDFDKVLVGVVRKDDGPHKHTLAVRSRTTRWWSR